MKRILFNSTQIKASKPGYDVTTATTDQLTFDTRGGKYLSVYLQGSIAYSSFVQTYYASGSYGYVKVMSYTQSFGTTFASPPIVLVSAQDPIQTDGTCVVPSYQNENSGLAYGGGFSTGTGGRLDVSISTTTTGLTVSITIEVFSVNTYTPPTPTFINYTVLRTS